jgi:hypothetical protein
VRRIIDRTMIARSADGHSIPRKELVVQRLGSFAGDEQTPRICSRTQMTLVAEE